ncbi:GAF and ANTAR domain-containing protein [uncultured Pseudokineococcus sp.]|uniref:GAF and ANTAR domain-containing protein n=1 Tax=uncultured Pseudokineococcus sp. TaxID=1642928 RepID=UPI002629DC7D|nr:GAF and ANTAR domain-containing protein [uncultured Pseudokineococcus sp.]
MSSHDPREPHHRTPDHSSPPSAASAGAPAPGAAAHPALAALGQIPLDQPLGHVLQQVCDLASQVLVDVDALSVTLVDEAGGARSAAFAGVVAATLDERQYEDGFGPCMDAARSGGVVRIRDTDADATYPGFSALAHRHGVTSVVSVGVPWADRVVGALNLFSTGGAVLDDDSVEVAGVFAGYAGAALAHAALLTSTAEHAGQMQEAMRSRAVIEQAKGVLVAALGLEPEAAFAELSRRSQRTNTKLRDVAAQVVGQALEAHADPGVDADGGDRA